MNRKLNDDEDLKETIDQLNWADKILHAVANCLDGRCPAAIPHLETASAAINSAGLAIVLKTLEDNPEDFIKHPDGTFSLRNPPGSNVVKFQPDSPA